MKLILIPLFTASVLFGCDQDALHEPTYYSCDNSFAEASRQHIHHEKYKQLIDGITASGAPGIMMTIRDENGIWSGTSGKADLASDADLLSCNITRVGSTVKTFTAVTILMLQEEGKLSLDDKVTQYLSTDYLRGLANAKKATIRHLLQHSSGIYNYIINLNFQTASLNDLEKTWKPEELLSYARNQPANFKPGENVQYSNTNYILLGEIIEAVEKKPFYQVFEEKIFEPFGLSSTQFAAEDPVPDRIIRGYIDLYSNLNVVNSTHYSGWDYFTADGGLISNAYDLNRFLTLLFEGQVLTPKSMDEMTVWKAPNKQDSAGYKTYYGLGIFKIMTDYGPAYLHSGDAIGYFASMVYFPDQKVTITWATNGNYGKIDKFTQSKDAMNSIFKTVLEN